MAFQLFAAGVLILLGLAWLTWTWLLATGRLG